jgi:hypothetical protein
MNPRHGRAAVASDDPGRHVPFARDAHSDIHDVLVRTAADRAESEQIRITRGRLPFRRARVALDARTHQPRVAGTLNEIHAAPEWTSTMDEIAQEIVRI